jgi:hypothetical protein
MPEDRRPEAEMPLGRLLVRAHAGDRITAHAPAVVYDAQRHHHQQAAHAAREAQLAREHGRHQVAAAHDAQAAHHAAAAARLDDIADARAAWLTTHHETLHAADAARAELLRRGHHPHIAADRTTTATGDGWTTAAEWLAAERAARHADDRHRTITAADLVPPDDHMSASSPHDDHCAAASDETATPGGGPVTRERDASTVEPGEPTTPPAEDSSTRLAEQVHGIDDGDMPTPIVETLSAGASAAEILTAAHHAARARDRLADHASLDATDPHDPTRELTDAADLGHDRDDIAADEEWLYLTRRASTPDPDATLDAGDRTGHSMTIDGYDVDDSGAA